VLYCYDFKKDELEEEPLWDDKLEDVFASTLDKYRGNQGCVVLDMYFQKFDHGFGRDYWRILGDPTYDKHEERKTILKPLYNLM